MKILKMYGSHVRMAKVTFLGRILSLICLAILLLLLESLLNHILIARLNTEMRNNVTNSIEDSVSIKLENGIINAKYCASQSVKIEREKACSNAQKLLLVDLKELTKKQYDEKDIDNDPSYLLYIFETLKVSQQHNKPFLEKTIWDEFPFNKISDLALKLVHTHGNFALSCYFFAFFLIFFIHVIFLYTNFEPKCLSENQSSTQQ